MCHQITKKLHAATHMTLQSCGGRMRPSSTTRLTEIDVHDVARVSTNDGQNYRRKTALMCVCHEYNHLSNREWKRRVLLERETNLHVEFACDTRRPRCSVSIEKRLIFSRKNTVWQSRKKKWADHKPFQHKKDLPRHFNRLERRP